MAREVVLCRPCALGLITGCLLLFWGAIIVVVPQTSFSSDPSKVSNGRFLHALPEVTARHLFEGDGTGSVPVDSSFDIDLPGATQPDAGSSDETESTSDDSEDTQPKKHRHHKKHSHPKKEITTTPAYGVDDESGTAAPVTDDDGTSAPTSTDTGDAEDDDMFFGDGAGPDGTGSPGLSSGNPTAGGQGATNLPKGTYVVEGADGKLMVLKEKDIKTLKAIKERNRWVMMAMFCVSTLLQVVFAYFYKQKIVDQIRVQLTQRPASPMQDFEKGIFSCFEKPDMIGYACCCGIVRRAHTYHVAGLLEYWPTVWVLVALSCVPRVSCCIDVMFFTYFRMKLKEKMGIKPEVLNDFCISLFCNPCATAQEAMAIDDELVAHVECFLTLKQPGSGVPEQAAAIATTAPTNEARE